MKKVLVTLSVITGAVMLVLMSCKEQTADKMQIAEVNHDSLVKRGDYLVLTMMCDDCHSPKRMGPNGPEVIPELRLSGFNHNNKLPAVDTSEIKKGWTLFNPDFTSFIGVWGASFAANLTSDVTGIGNWSEEQFLTAIRKGKLKGLEGSRPLLPPMPWQQIRNLTDNDLKAIYAYLKSTKPVDNLVPAPKALAELN